MAAHQPHLVNHQTTLGREASRIWAWLWLSRMGRSGAERFVVVEWGPLSSFGRDWKNCAQPSSEDSSSLSAQNDVAHILWLGCGGENDVLALDSSLLWGGWGGVRFLLVCLRLDELHAARAPGAEHKAWGCACTAPSWQAHTQLGSPKPPQPRTAAALGCKPPRGQPKASRSPSSAPYIRPQNCTSRGGRACAAHSWQACAQLVKES